MEEELDSPVLAMKEGAVKRSSHGGPDNSQVPVCLKAMRLVAVALAMTFVATGCGIKGGMGEIGDSIENATKYGTDNVVGVLDDAIFSLNTNSQSWQRVLQDSIAKLPDDGASIVRNELNTVMTQAVAALGLEIRCITDHLGDSVKAELKRIRAGLLGDEMPAQIPRVCQATPDGIELTLEPNARNHINFYGSNFDTDGLSAALINKRGQRRNISSALDRLSPYQVSLNLTTSGASPSPTDARYVLDWQETELSSVPIREHQASRCKIQDFTFDPGSKTVSPKFLSTGDKEFDGNGPRMQVSVRLDTDSQRRSLTAKVALNAFETNGGDTRASGTEMFQISPAIPAGMEIAKILSNTEDKGTFYPPKENYHEKWPRIDRGAGSPVQYYEFYGDQGGLDEHYTRVQIRFNPEITLQLKQTENCSDR